MSNKSLTIKEVWAIGLMLFALFLGAGNLIFPPALGQAAGSNIWFAIIGFLITGVGLPLMGITAIAISGGNLQSIASRANPKFGILFSVVAYLAIGPLFGIPRTGTVSYEIAISPLLPEKIGGTSLSLFIFTLIFFGITYWLSLNPTKLVDRIGKLLTPVLIVVLGLIGIKGAITPLGSFQSPLEAYANSPLTKGFIEGYLTMDAIAALIFGIVVISAIKEKGIKENKMIANVSIKAGLIAASGLALVYISLAYIGATSVEQVGYASNGGEILAVSSKLLFGSIGSIILGLAIIFACLTTSVGLVSSCAQYFSNIMPKLSYKTIVLLLSIFSAIIANVGLTQLIKISLPILIMIYPLAIVLIVLTFLHRAINGYSEVYNGALLGAGIIAILDGIKTAGVNIDMITNHLSFLPLLDQGLGWLVPAIVGGILGYIIARVKHSSAVIEQN